MARIRTVKPEHWNDKELSKISLPAHLLWIGMWNFSDDSGVIENDPILIKSQIFPRRTDVKVDQVKKWLSELSKAGFILPFEYDKEGYFVHRTFKKHQRVDKPQPSKVPYKLVENALNTFLERSENNLESLSLVEYSKVEESKSKGKEGRVFVAPTLEMVQEYFLKNGYSKEAATKAFNYYNDAEPAWTDSYGKQVRSWKSKMQAVWFKPENKAIEIITEEKKQNDLDNYLAQTGSN